MTHVQIVVYQDHQVVFLKVAVYTAGPKLVELQTVIPPQVKDLAFTFVKLFEVPDNPFLQLVKVFLNGSATFLHIDCSPDLVSSMNVLTLHSVTLTRLLTAILNSICLTISL